MRSSCFFTRSIKIRQKYSMFDTPLPVLNVNEANDIFLSPILIFSLSSLYIAVVSFGCKSGKT